MTHQEFHAAQADRVFFQRLSNGRIFCHFSEPPGQSSRLVVMCHGFKGNSTGPARGFVNFSRVLVQHDYSVLRFDQPNCGNSDGPFLEVSFNEWVETIAELTEEYAARGYRISLLGESMGASAAIVASNMHRIRGKVSALLLWSPDPVTSSSVDLDAIYEERGQKFRGRFWQEAREAYVLACLRAFEGSIHLVYGGLDKVVGRDMSKLIEVVSESEGTVLILDDEGHTNWREDTARMFYLRETEKLNVWMA